MKLEQITASQLEALLNKKEAIEVIDVRESFELEMGKVPEAIHIPLQQLLHKTSQLDRNKRYAIICHSGSRSEVACKLLEMHGLQTMNVIDGMLGWQGKLVKKTE